MPGLLRGVARTAVVAGTASAVNGRVQRRQAARFASRTPRSPPTATRRTRSRWLPRHAAAPQVDVVSQLKQLAELKEQGILTEAEFAAQKAKLLG